MSRCGYILSTIQGTPWALPILVSPLVFGTYHFATHFLPSIFSLLSIWNSYLDTWQPGQVLKFPYLFSIIHFFFCFLTTLSKRFPQLYLSSLLWTISFLVSCFNFPKLWFLFFLQLFPFLMTVISEDIYSLVFFFFKDSFLGLFSSLAQ